MTAPATSVWLVAGYALVLALMAWGFDAMARRVSRHAARWRTAGFLYRPDHDAWVCPQDQWLWPTSFDPRHRVMRYRALPVVCNSCPVKSTCTTSDHGREISREIDPWPYSDAGRFHRGIACFVAALGVIMPLACHWRATCGTRRRTHPSICRTGPVRKTRWQRRSTGIPPGGAAAGRTRRTTRSDRDSDRSRSGRACGAHRAGVLLAGGAA
jgi:hypothetical protein